MAAMAAMANRFSDGEARIIRRLTTPRKIQDFINGLEMNFDYDEDTCQSPRQVLKSGMAHCVEGAILAAAILRHHGHRPLLLDLEATDRDYDHVVALFRQHGCWGAISKTNHAVLRYREPIYRTLRELALSYFHEYFLHCGRKTLRRYSAPFNLRAFDARNWVTSEEEVWFIPERLTEIRHYPILSRRQIATLRRADAIEIAAGRLTEFPDPRARGAAPPASRGSGH